jgi:TP901 family phage tail tape measure protein
MSEQPVKRSDLVAEDAITSIKKDLDDGLASLEAWDKHWKSIATTMQGDLKTAMTDTLKGIDAIDKAEKESEQLLKKKMATEQASLKLKEQDVKLRNARIKAVDDYNKKLKKEDTAIKKSAEIAKKATEKKRLEELKLDKAREKAFDDYERSLKKQQAQEEKAVVSARKLKKSTIDNTNAFKRLEKQTNTARDRFKRLSVQYGETDKRTNRARKNFMRLDRQLRKVNNSALDGRRDVGRYGLATEKMGNSVRKVTGLLAKMGLAIGGIQLLRGSITLISDFDSSIASLGAITGKTGSNLEELKDKVLEVSNETGKSAVEISEAMKLVGAAQPELLKSADALASVTKQAVILAQAGGIDVPKAADALTNAMNQFGVGAEEAAKFVDILSTSQQMGTAPVEKLSEALVKAGGTAKAFGITFEEANVFLQAWAKGGVLGSEAGTQFSGVLSKLAKVNRKEFNPSIVGGKVALDNLIKANLSYTDLIKLTDTEGAKWITTLQNQASVVAELDGKLLDVGNAQKQANQNMDTLAGATEQAKTALQNYILGADGATSVSDSLKVSLQFLANNIAGIVKTIGYAVQAFVAWKVAMFALKISDQISDFRKYGKSIGDVTKATEGGVSSAKKLGTALKGIGLSVAITLILELAKAYWAAVSGANALIDSQGRLEKQLAVSNEKANKRVENRTKNIEKETKALEDQAKIDIANSKSDKETLKITEDLIKSKARLVSINRSKIKTDIELAELAKTRLKDDFDEAKIIQSRIKAGIKLNSEQLATGKRLKLFTTDISGVVADINGIKKSTQVINELSAEIKGARARISIYKTELEGTSNATNDLTQEQLLLIASSKEDVDEKNKQKQSTKDLTDELVRQLEVIKTIQEEREAFDVENAQASADRELAIAVELAENTGKVNTKLFLLRLDQEEKLRRAIIERQFIEAIDLATSDVDVVLAGQRRNQEIEKLDTEFIDRRKDGIKELNEAQEGYAEGLVKSNDKIKSSQNELLKTIIGIEQAITDAIEDQINKRIALKEDEKKASQDAQAFFQQLAANGNIEAKQSIKEQIAFQKEAQREIDRLERQKANVKLFSAGLQAFQNSIEGGATPGEALTQTVLTTTVLTGLLSGLLNFFEVGTMNAPEGMAVVDEKGAEIITDKKGNIKSFGTDSGPRMTYLNSGDKVYTATQTASKLSSLDNANNAQQMATKKDSAGNSFDLIAMQNGIGKAFDNSIKKIPHSSTNWGAIGQGMGKVIEDNVRGNDVKRTNHRIS